MTLPITDILHAQERDGAVQSLFRRGVTFVPLTPIPGLACGADITTRRMPGLGLQSGTVWGNRHQYTRANAANGSDDLSIHINLSGVSIVAGRRREMTLHDGDAIFFSDLEPRTVTRPGRVNHRIIRLPRASLAPVVPDIDDAVLRPIPRGTGALTLLTSYAGALIDDVSVATPQMRQLFIAQLCDLMAVTLSATRDAQVVSDSRGIRAARLNAIKRDIEAHLADSDLSPPAVAARQRISDSYIRKLFEREGTSFSEFVLARRLARAYRMLTDQRWGERTIASIAFETGFGDLSYFNRTFKRSYDFPPSEIRRRGQDADSLTRSHSLIDAS